MHDLYLWQILWNSDVNMSYYNGMITRLMMCLVILYSFTFYIASGCMHAVIIILCWQLPGM